MISRVQLVFLLKQAGVALIYAAILYIGESLFEGGDSYGYFEASTGFALAVILLGGRKYAYGLISGALALRMGMGESFLNSLIAASGDTFQALLGHWLINYKRIFDPHLKTLRDYLVLILLGGCASMAVGAVLTNTAFLISGELESGEYLQAMLRWWMSDTLGIILIAPLILVWQSKEAGRIDPMRVFEATLFILLTLVFCGLIFFDMGHGTFFGVFAKSYWMFLIVSWAAVSLGSRETMIVLVLTASCGLTGAIEGVGYFGRDIEESLLANYWFFMTILSVVGMALATYFTERKLAAREIHNLAFYDPLTQLPNRRLLLDRLQQVRLSSERSGKHFMLAYIDLDRFKNINDTLGHDFGDILLKQVAQRLTAKVRKSDTVALLDSTVARLGGDEFVVLIEDLNEKPLEAAIQAETVCRKLLQEFSLPFSLGAAEYRCSASIGVGLFNGTALALDELLKQTDIAMYQVKNAGRNNLQFFNPEMQEAILQRTVMENELHQALASGQFQLHYQLQLDSTMRPLGAEGLIRWIHPVRGMVSPAKFIPMAEESGMILAIGRWVIDTACTQIKLWQQDPHTRGLTLAINVSAKQFQQADFVEQVTTAIQRNGIAPSLLKLELTESMLQADIDGTIEKMGALKKLGVQFSLDDFGTGYSSLQYIKRLPLDQIKIDQSFVRDIDSDESDKVIVRTIIAMAHSLDMEVIAEGVETQSQRSLLHSLNCTNYQGYLFSKPLAADSFERLLKEQTYRPVEPERASDKQGAKSSGGVWNEGLATP